MLLVIFTGSLLPYLQCLDSWLYDGILDDPYEEMFFYANNAVTIDEASFWEMSYVLRVRGSQVDSSSCLTDSESIRKKESGNQESIAAAAAMKAGTGSMDILCPVFLKDIARAIVSAGKSFQLIKHVQDGHRVETRRGTWFNADQDTSCRSQHKFWPDISSSRIQVGDPIREDTVEESTGQFGNYSNEMGLLTLSEIFLICLSGLLENGDHVYEYLQKFHADSVQPKAFVKSGVQETKETCAENNSEKTWVTLLRNAISGRKYAGGAKTSSRNTVITNEPAFIHGGPKNASSNGVESHLSLSCYENPAIVACKDVLQRNQNSWSALNISETFHLPPLNDENIRRAIFAGGHSEGTSTSGDTQSTASYPRLDGTDYKFGFQFNDLEYVRQEDDRRILEELYAFPTLLPCANENVPLSEILPMQKDSTLALKVFQFIQSMSLKDPLQPVGIIQECLSRCIKRQLDHIGKKILSKLMGEWRLMDELSVLRAIYLLGSGDMLQQFLITIFDKLDIGNSWDDDFELNNLLQESIRNSADKMLLTAPDSLVVTLAKHDTRNGDESASTSRKGRALGFGIDALDVLNFTYKVSWPLDLIVNTEALKKYNQVMGFLLKVKRAKFILDQTRKWMWKDKGRAGHNFKQQLIVEQKLLHFVDAFHQYVMDRVYHSAWTELCDGMASATTLDEVMEVHEAYLSSIQRQCFVASDKLWSLIASRVKTILGLALDFHNIKQTLSTAGTASAVRTRCEMEVDRIEKQFDECVVFLLRILSFKLNVGHFPHLADLVTRINYNRYFMSDNGSFSAIPGSGPR